MRVGKRVLKGIEGKRNAVKGFKNKIK